MSSRSQRPHHATNGASKSATEDRQISALLPCEDLYRLAFEGNPYAMYVCDAETLRILAANDAAVRHYGYTRDELLGMTVDDICHTGDGPTLSEDLPLGRIAKSLPDRTVRHREKGGPIGHVEITSLRLSAPGRQVWLVLAHDAADRKHARESLQDLQENIEALVQQRMAALEAEIAERKRIERELFEGQQMFKALVENAPEIICRFDRECRYVYVNPALERVTGIPLETFVGRSFGDLWSPADLSDVWRGNVQEVFATGEDRFLEFEYDSPRGRRWYQSRFVPERDRDGHVVSTLVVCVDVTGHKRTEQALRESKERTHRILDTAHDAFIAIDESGVIVDWNRRAETMFGWPREQALGRSLTDTIIPEAMRKAHTEGMKRYLETGESRVLQHGWEVEAQRSDGSLFPVEMTIWPMQTTNGYLFNAFIRDISDRKQAEKEQLKFASLVQHSSEFIGMATMDGRPIFLNEAGRKLLGLDAEDDFDEYIVAAHPPDAQKQLLDEIMPALRTVGRWEGESQMANRRTGALIDVWMNCFVLRDPETDEPLCIAMITRDITERKREEQELRSAKQAAEEANQAKSRFLANMSHELRTPLNAILGFSEMLLDQIGGPLNEKQTRYVDHVLTSGQHLLQLINDVLDLAKIDAGRLQLDCSELDASKMLHGIESIVAGIAMKKKIAVSVEVDPTLPHVIADEAKFKQIAYNLLSNAVKFTPEGGSVTVRASEHREGRRSWLKVAVVDSGIGVKPDDQERIFGQFEQVDSSYARQQQGTGLGLALTRRLVELHDGRIWVESSGIEGKGSVFTFLLPLRGPEKIEEIEGKSSDRRHGKRAVPSARECAHSN